MANSLEIIYKSYSDVEVRIDDKNGTVWLNKNEIAKLFGIDRSGVSRHINNIFKTQELEEISNMQKMHIPISYKIEDYTSNQSRTLICLIPLCEVTGI